MKVKKLLNGYALRLNDSEFAALSFLLEPYLLPEVIVRLTQRISKCGDHSRSRSPASDL